MTWGAKYKSLPPSLKGVGWGKFPTTGIWAQWISAFAGMTRERRLTVLFILSLLNDLQQAISSMEWFDRLTMSE